LRSAYAAHLLVLERGQHPLQDCRRPDDIVVGKDGDFSSNLWDSLAHLATLVGLWDTDDSDFLAINGRRHPPSIFYIGINRDDYDLVGLSCQTGLDSPAKLVSVSIDGGDNDGNIVGCIGRIRGNRDWLERPM